MARITNAGWGEAVGSKKEIDKRDYPDYIPNKSDIVRRMPMFENVIVDQNPHWNGAPYDGGVSRSILAEIKNNFALPYILSIVGVRRCGKSTLIRQIINHLIGEKKIAPKNILFLNLEHPGFSRYKGDVAYLERIYEDYLKLAAPEGMVYCFLDEVHYFSEWQVFVKAHYEQKMTKFIVTGSNSRLLSSEFITLLSGRTIPVEVYPFSFGEFMRARGMTATDTVSLTMNRHQIRKLMDDYLQFGGFPETAFLKEPETIREIHAMYARSILYQDVAPRFGIKKPADLENLFYYLAANASSLYTFNSLAKLTNLSDKTIKEYLSCFSHAYLLFTVDAFSYSVKQQTKSPKKIYSIDSGLAGSVSFRFSDDTGRYLENAVFLELRRRGKELYYYRTGNGYEVDFICRNGREVTDLIQVAKELRDEKTKSRELRALFKAMDETGLTSGTIITCEEEEEITENSKIVTIIPAYKFFSET